MSDAPLSQKVALTAKALPSLFDEPMPPLPLAELPAQAELEASVSLMDNGTDLAAKLDGNEAGAGAKAALGAALACAASRPAGVPEGAAWRPFKGERPSSGDGDIAVMISAKLRKLQQRVKKERASERLFVVRDEMDDLLRGPKSQPMKLLGLTGPAAASLGLLRLAQGAFRSAATMTGEHLWLDDEAWDKVASVLRQEEVEWSARQDELRANGGCRLPVGNVEMDLSLVADADRAEAVAAVATILRSLLTFLKGTK